MVRMPRGKLPINCAARNAVWVYPRVASPRFRGAPAIVETVRSHEMPDLSGLPQGADVTVELYGGACSLWLDGGQSRVYVRRFRHAPFPSEQEARRAFLELWREVERLGSPAEVVSTAERWVERTG
jgi:hypothetical protein